MDNLAYLINRNFCLIAVDTNYNDKIDGVQLKIPNAKKIYKLNETSLISIIGNQVKASDVKNYIIKLNKMGHANDFYSIVDDLKAIFNTDNTNIIEGMKEVIKLIPDGQDVELSQVLSKLQDKPEYANLLTDVLSQLQRGLALMTQVMVFGWDKSSQSCKLSHLVYVGNNLNGNEDHELAEDFLYIKFSTSKLKNPISKEEEWEMVKSIHLEPGWDIDNDSVSAIIDKGKEILTQGLHKLNSYDTLPKIVFYELSHRTNFKFSIPDIHLTEITYSRKRHANSDISESN